MGDAKYVDRSASLRAFWYASGLTSVRIYRGVRCLLVRMIERDWSILMVSVEVRTAAC